MMESKVLEKYLHDHIPISAAMEVEVLEAGGDGVTLRAPLGPNINHRETVFGGSAGSLAILAAWSLVHIRLRQVGITSRIVIQRNTTDYDLPIHGPFTASSSIRDSIGWEKFMRVLERKGRARIFVSSILEYEGEVAGRFEGLFVALDGSGG